MPAGRGFPVDGGDKFVIILIFIAGASLRPTRDFA
jgi:hypothetical protein